MKGGGSVTIEWWRVTGRAVRQAEPRPQGFRTRRGGTSRNAPGSLCARRSGPGGSTGDHPGVLHAPRLESAGCARKIQPCARRCGGGDSTRENHERVQSVRQPGAEPAGRRRTRSETLGAPWKHALAMEERGCKARSSVHNRRSGRGHGSVRRGRELTRRRHPLPCGPLRSRLGIRRSSPLLCRALPPGARHKSERSGNPSAAGFQIQTAPSLMTTLSLAHSHPRRQASL